MMMDRGWRRSGSYLYLPDRQKTCCPPYTIRCSASGFKPSRSQRQSVYRWKKHLHESVSEAPRNPTTKSGPAFDLTAIFKSVEAANNSDGQTRFKIVIEPASFSQEKYELYKKYQIMVHNDPPEKISENSFRNFLCSHPFTSSDTAHHARWEIDGKLIAFSVLDFLPFGISSVYLVWDPEYSKLGLGRLSALREVAWIQEWRNDKFDAQFDWYYLGYYIHSCAKMKYKGEYQPSFLLDPSSYSWKPLASCLQLLDDSSTNLVTFEDGPPVRDHRPIENCIIRALSRTGKITLVKATDPKIELLVNILGKELIAQVLIFL